LPKIKLKTDDMLNNKILIPITILMLTVLFSRGMYAQTTWTGTNGASWTDPGNWSAGVPDAADDVTIPDVANDPVIAGTTSALAKSVEVQSGAILTIGATASLTVNGSKLISGLTTAFYNNGTVENNGQLILGNISILGDIGIRNESIFNNNAGAEISIDRTTIYGLFNNSGTFTNAAKITIGAIASVGDYGLWNQSTFNNNAGSEISIDRSNFLGMYNFGTFTNAAKITIGAIASVGDYGIYNDATFNNNAGSEISIDRSTNTGMYNIGTFTNAAKITIGAIASVGSNGILNITTFNNSVCSSLINIVSDNIILGDGDFTNVGRIIENASGISYILNNTGVVQNLNGGTFSIGSGNPATTFSGQLSACCPSGDILYVNKNATGLDDGTSWTNAYVDLQSALNSPCPGITQIWVAPGHLYSYC
jgi:hypothetical protein